VANDRLTPVMQLIISEGLLEMPRHKGAYEALSAADAEGHS
jgi:hypothetical protein